MDRTTLKHLFKNNPATTLVEAALDQGFGDIYTCTDTNNNVTSAFSLNFIFVLVDGEISSDCSKYLPAISNCEYVEIVSSNPKWYDHFIKNSPKKNFMKKRRVFDSSSISTDNLNKILSQAPSNCSVERLTLSHKDFLQNDYLYEDIIGSFESYEDLMDKGVSFGLFEDGKLAAICSSFSRLSDGIEIEIDTKPEFRKKGYASIVAASALKYCLENGLVPHWDAANDISCCLAKKLGYTLDYEYDTLVLHD